MGEFRDTYYLWDPRNGISVGRELEKQPGMVKLGPRGLDAALLALSMKAVALGKSRNLKIHCHGSPARIRLGSDLGISRSNVASFGNRLRCALLPGALIEILACEVAAQEAKGVLVLTAPANIQGYVPEYHAKLQEAIKESRRERGWETPAVRPSEKYIPEPNWDGLEFCLSLAQAAGATVRAAVLPQAEEGAGRERDILMPNVSPIGNWEGPVFDFYMNRTVRFQGVSLFRPTSWGPIRVDIGGPVGIC